MPSPARKRQENVVRKTRNRRFELQFAALTIGIFTALSSVTTASADICAQLAARIADLRAEEDTILGTAPNQQVFDVADIGRIPTEDALTGSGTAQIRTLRLNQARLRQVQQRRASYERQLARKCREQIRAERVAAEQRAAIAAQQAIGATLGVMGVIGAGQLYRRSGPGPLHRGGH
jgi:hypothetical protein